jgi:hypothetical protein
LHMLNVLARHHDHVVAMPHQRPYGANLAIWPERCMQQAQRMQLLDPLAFMKIGALSRHVFHVPRIHQTWLDSVLLQHVVHRNPIHSGGLHGCCGDATTDQPFGHLMQISSEGLALANRMGIPVRRHGHEDLSGSDVDARRIRLKHRPIRLHRLLRLLPRTCTCGWYGALAAANLLLPRCSGHSDSFRSGNRPSRAKNGTLLIGISPGWCAGP